jgi:hypothetical protein
MRLPLIFLALSLLSAPTITADSQNLNESGTAFLADCSAFDSPNNTQEAVVCLAWIEGFVNGALVTEIFHKTPEKDQMFCLPSGVTSLQAGRVIRKYIVDHPEREHMPTEYLASEALIYGFPCKQ